MDRLPGWALGAFVVLVVLTWGADVVISAFTGHPVASEAQVLVMTVAAGLGLGVITVRPGPGGGHGRR